MNDQMTSMPSNENKAAPSSTSVNKKAKARKIHSGSSYEQNMSSYSNNYNNALNISPSEWPIFHAIMAIMCASIAVLLLWVARDGIRNPDWDGSIGWKIIYVSTLVTIFIASYFSYLAVVASYNLFRNVKWRKRNIVHPSRKLPNESEKASSSPLLATAEEDLSMV